MSTPELTTVLEECLRLAGTVPTLDKETFKSTRGLLSAELNSLLQEAMDMKWPFVEEKWQYKRSVESEDKVNTIDLIKQHLPQLIAFLKACISAAEPLWAMSVVFLMDRFLYLIDSSHTLLKIAKALHRRYPETPVAPQIVIRQARIYLNTGKLQKAEYILSSLISNCGATGCWKYHRDSDRILVQAVSVQVRGQVLQKLGLWLEAAELIWASLIGFYILPLPDKKGIGTSLGLLASVLISMNDEDFATFQTRPHINLGFLGDCRHRLLCAAQAAKMAVVYSQFGSLYVLTHMVTQGTCLLSYSFSKNCPAAEKPHYLTLAKEAFENGLLTKAETDAVTSQQELHTLIKAAYCLAITNKWMFGLAKEVTMAIQSCQEANALLYFYCFKDDSNKGAVSSEVMAKVQRIKSLLKVKAFVSSDPCSFIPDSYRAMKDKPVAFTLGDFTKMMEGFQKHHKSVCEAFKASEQKGRRSGQGAAHANCITAFQTTLTESFTTECTSTSLQADANKDIMDSNKPRGPSVEVFQKEILDATLDFDEYHPDHCSSRGSKLGENSKEGVKSEAQGARTSQGSSSLGSSWINMPDSEASSVLVDPFCCTEAEDDVYDEKIGHGASAEAVRNNVTGCSGANAADASDRIGDNHQTGMLALLQSAGVLDKGGNTQQQSKQDLSTTLESEDGDQILSKIDVNGTGKGKERRMTSGSLNSSLGSSWQSISFSKSLPTGEFAEILKDKSIIDQKCETVTSEDSPDSPFELINLNSSALPISKGGQTTSGSQEQCCSQRHVQDQSAIETVEDPEVSFLSNGLSGFALADYPANGLNAKNASANSQKGHLRESDSRNNQLNQSLLSTEFESYEMVQSELTTQGTTASPNKAKHNDPVDSQMQNNLKAAPLLETEAEDYQPSPVFAKLEKNLGKNNTDNTFPTSMKSCKGCFEGCTMGNVVLTEQDYKSLFSGVCQDCLLKRLPERTFKLSQYSKAYSALVLKYSKATDRWTGCETSVYVGELLEVAVKGGQRQAFRIQYLHQEQMLGSYVGKEYLRERKAHAHLADVERQMTAQYYVMEFNKCLYESNITTQIFYIPSELLLILEDDCIVACISVEPYMLGEFVKLTNNRTKRNERYSTTKYGIAFGHFTFEFSKRKEVVVDLQGWVTANGKGLVYLTDPQIHSIIKPKSPSNFHKIGIMEFLQEQHGEDCSPICRTALNNLKQRSTLKQ
ncbi:alpha-protein kinase 1 [Pygocentrus nattereri]|uniref:alpha-protein kinase 1 n=1 Tax=Pygocentrus nattereri TaxID=42514 RepID=UPI000814A307|nr:alpha-protein kinase 1 [Pygocentrus nattereri]